MKILLTDFFFFSFFDRLIFFLLFFFYFFSEIWILLYENKCLLYNSFSSFLFFNFKLSLFVHQYNCVIRDIFLIHLLFPSSFMFLKNMFTWVSFDLIHFYSFLFIFCLFNKAFTSFQRTWTACSLFLWVHRKVKDNTRSSS